MYGNDYSWTNDEKGGKEMKGKRGVEWQRHTVSPALSLQNTVVNASSPLFPFNTTFPLYSTWRTETCQPGLAPEEDMCTAQLVVLLLLSWVKARPKVSLRVLLEGVREEVEEGQPGPEVVR